MISNWSRPIRTDTPPGGGIVLRIRFAGAPALADLIRPAKAEAAALNHAFHIDNRHPDRQDPQNHLAEQDHPPRSVHVRLDALDVEPERGPGAAVHAPWLVEYWKYAPGRVWNIDGTTRNEKFTVPEDLLTAPLT